MKPPPFASFKKSGQAHRIRLIGAQLNCVDSCRAKQSSEIRLGAGLPLSETATLASIAGIDLDDFAGFGIVEHQPAQSWEFQLKTIGDLHGDDVMPSIDLAQHGKGCLC